MDALILKKNMNRKYIHEDHQGQLGNGHPLPIGAKEIWAKGAGTKDDPMVSWTDPNWIPDNTLQADGCVDVMWKEAKRMKFSHVYLRGANHATDLDRKTMTTVEADPHITVFMGKGPKNVQIHGHTYVMERLPNPGEQEPVPQRKMNHGERKIDRFGLPHDYWFWEGESAERKAMTIARKTLTPAPGRFPQQRATASRPQPAIKPAALPAKSAASAPPASGAAYRSASGPPPANKQVAWGPRNTGSGQRPTGSSNNTASASGKPNAWAPKDATSDKPPAWKNKENSGWRPGGK